MKSVILNRGQDFYTDIEAVFNAVGGAYKNYNWLVTEPDATFKNDIFYSKFFNADYVWITGEELKEVAKQSNQFIWGIFSGFEKDITLEKVLEYELPSTECNAYWEENASIQHPLAETEIYAFDSSCTFVLSKTYTIIDKFINQFPMARELVLYNIRKKKAFKSIEEIIFQEIVNRKIENEDIYINMKYGIWQYLYQRNDNNIDDEEILNHFRKLIRREEKEGI